MIRTIGFRIVSAKEAEERLRRRVSVADYHPDDPTEMTEQEMDAQTAPADVNPIVGRCRECPRPVRQAAHRIYGWYCSRECLRQADR